MITRYARFRIIALEPLRSLLIRFKRSCLISYLDFVNLRQILLMRSCASEVSFRDVVLDCFIEYACRIFRVRFSVYFERLCPRVGCIVGLVKGVLKDRGCFLEGLPSLLVCDGEIAC